MQRNVLSMPTLVTGSLDYLRTRLTYLEVRLDYLIVQSSFLPEVSVEQSFFRSHEHAHVRCAHQYFGAR